MKTLVCMVLLAACALGAPTPGGWGLPSLGYSSYSVGAPVISHARLVYSAPAAVIHEPAVISVKKIVSVPQVVSVRKVVSAPLVARYVSPRVYRTYSSDWW